MYLVFDKSRSRIAALLSIQHTSSNCTHGQWWDLHGILSTIMTGSTSQPFIIDLSTCYHHLPPNQTCLLWWVSIVIRHSQSELGDISNQWYIDPSSLMQIQHRDKIVNRYHTNITLLTSLNNTISTLPENPDFVCSKRRIFMEDAF